MLQMRHACRQRDRLDNYVASTYLLIPTITRRPHGAVSRDVRQVLRHAGADDVHRNGAAVAEMLYALPDDYRASLTSWRCRARHEYAAILNNPHERNAHEHA